MIIGKQLPAGTDVRMMPGSPVRVDGKTYYWLIFSSTRTGLPGIMRTSVPAGSCFPMITYISQLYVTGLVVDESGAVNTFPAIYVWNQPPQYINTTPAWEDFVIPIVQ